MKKISLFLLATILFINIYAQEKTFGFDFNHVALSVKDLQVSALFYQNVLGLKEITNRTKKEGIRWFSLGGKELHLISTKPGEVKLTMADHFALTTPLFDNFVTSIVAAHITYTDWAGAINTISTRADGIKQIYLQDPDGYWIEVNSAEIK